MRPRRPWRRGSLCRQQGAEGVPVGVGVGAFGFAGAEAGGDEDLAQEVVQLGGGKPFAAGAAGVGVGGVAG